MIKAFEGVRGLAALIVALYHLDAGTRSFSLIRHGYIFVDLFFVLSGFVICASYSTRMESVEAFKSFVIRRFGRLFPLLAFSTFFYIVAFNAIVLLKNLAISHGFGAALSNPAALEYLVPNGLEIVSTLTFTHSLGLFDRLILNTPTWSISAEFYAYLLFAAACLFLKGKSRLVAFAAFILIAFTVIAWASISIYGCLDKGDCNTQTFDFGFPRCVLSFFLGALTYKLKKVVKPGPELFQLPALALLVAYFWQVENIPALSFLPPCIFAVFVFSISSDRGPMTWLFNRKFSQVLGQRSYSIYLMHLPLVLFFDLLAKRANGMLSGTVVVASYVAALFILSGWTFRYIEDPWRLAFNRISDNMGRNRIATNDAIANADKISRPNEAVPTGMNSFVESVKKEGAALAKEEAGHA